MAGYTSHCLYRLGGGTDDAPRMYAADRLTVFTVARENEIAPFVWKMQAKRVYRLRVQRDGLLFPRFLFRQSADVCVWRTSERFVDFSPGSAYFFKTSKKSSPVSIGLHQNKRIENTKLFRCNSLRVRAIFEKSSNLLIYNDLIFLMRSPCVYIKTLAKSKNLFIKC